jgi:pyrroline-5-carboxylate reductase
MVPRAHLVPDRSGAHSSLPAPRASYADSMMSVALLGGGRMGEALLAGLLDAGWDAEGVAVAEVDAERRRVLEERFPEVRIVPSPAWAVADAALVVVAVKPGDVVGVLEQCATTLPEKTVVLSIAAGVTIETLETGAPDRPVVRAMPNTAALARQGAAAISSGKHATDADLDLAERVLAAVGEVVRVPEHLLDAVTGLSGSGPAYVFLVAEAMVEAGVLAGLPRDTAARLVNQTLLGAATLLTEDPRGPEALRAAVTSPGGTTAAGLRELELHGVRAAFLEAVAAATERSRELGRPPS